MDLAVIGSRQRVPELEVGDAGGSKVSTGPRILAGYRIG